ncbi:hypothetical protein AVEN_194186-2-1, partial [Araneus ventricosus]
NRGGFRTMIGESVKKFSQSHVMSIIAMGSIPIRNLAKNANLE